MHFSIHRIEIHWSNIYMGAEELYTSLSLHSRIEHNFYRVAFFSKIIEIRTIMDVCRKGQGGIGESEHKGLPFVFSDIDLF